MKIKPIDGEGPFIEIHPDLTPDERNARSEALRKRLLKERCDGLAEIIETAVARGVLRALAQRDDDPYKGMGIVESYVAAVREELYKETN